MAEEPVWLPVAEAARQLGVTPQAVRNRIARGTLEARIERMGNRTRRLVKVPGTVPATVPRPDGAAVRQGAGTPAEVAAELATLRERVAQQDRLIAHLEAELARRRWPGLRRWWRRLVEGEGG